jgi:hypothetical protein
MAQHGFNVGDVVRIVHSASTNPAEAFAIGRRLRDTSTVWTIVRLMPADERGPKYHIRAVHGTTRAVHESEIEKA